MKDSSGERTRKIVHVDMDCFYAAIEMRDSPELRGKPVAVGGSSSRRGVLTTCNYAAREFGCHSAMPTYKALRLCPDLIVVPVRFEAYRAESRRIRAIFARFTDLVEPLSLDEAYLDVTHWRSAGAAVAREIRDEIRETTGLTASAGIAPNKLLAKIASDWNKPDGQFEIRPGDIDAFMAPLPVRRLWGVGKKTAEKLARHGIETCAELQSQGLTELQALLGKFGEALFYQCRGVDGRPVQPSRERKSVSSERTFADDLPTLDAGLANLQSLWDELREDVAAHHGQRRCKSVFVKLRFSDFQQTSVERQAVAPSWDLYETLLGEGWMRGEGRPVRLIGLGVRFHSVSEDQAVSPAQLLLFDEAEASAGAEAD